MCHAIGRMRRSLHPPDAYARPHLDRVAALEVDDDASRDSGAVSLAARRVEAHIVQLGTEGQVGEKREIHAAAKTPGKLAVGGAPAANRDTRTDDQGLGEVRNP